jgi:hypothetical protein
MAKADDERSAREFVEAARKAGDPRVADYDRTRANARKAAPRKAVAKKAPAKKAAKAPAKRSRASLPVSGTPRFGGPALRAPRVPVPAPPAAAPVTAPLPPPVRVPRAPRVPVPPPPPAVRAPAPVGRGRGGGLAKGQHQAVQAGYHLSNRQQTNALLGGKPSVSGAAVGGAAGGAATGAALGSVVPGVGTGVGAGAGAVLGGAGGAVAGGKRKREWRKANSPAPGARKALVAEFTVCLLIVALSPLTDTHKTDPPGAWMKRMAAVMGVFLVLAILSAFGRGAARTAAAFGGLMAVTLAVSERDLFTKIADIFGGVPQAETPSHAGA